MQGSVLLHLHRAGDRTIIGTSNLERRCTANPDLPSRLPATGLALGPLASGPSLSQSQSAGHAHGHHAALAGSAGPFLFKAAPPITPFCPLRLHPECHPFPSLPSCRRLTQRNSKKKKLRAKGTQDEFGPNTTKAQKFSKRQSKAKPFCSIACASSFYDIYIYW